MVWYKGNNRFKTNDFFRWYPILRNCVLQFIQLEINVICILKRGRGQGCLFFSVCKKITFSERKGKH